MTTPILYDPRAVTEVKDWGPIPTMIEGRSQTSGRLLHKGPEGRSECGLWVCTPGTWRCTTSRQDWMCAFLLGVIRVSPEPCSRPTADNSLTFGTANLRNFALCS